MQLSQRSCLLVFPFPCKATTRPEIYSDKMDSCWLGTWHWGESGPGAQTHPSAPESLQWQASGAADWHGWGDGNINASFSRAPHPASAAVWKHNCNENPIDWSRFLLDKLHCFPCLSIGRKANVKSKRMKALKTSLSTLRADRQSQYQLQLQITQHHEFF